MWTFIWSGLTNPKMLRLLEPLLHRRYRCSSIRTLVGLTNDQLKADHMKPIMQNAAPTYCVIRNNRRPSLKRDERVIIVNRAGEWRLAFSPRSPSGDIR